MAGEKIRREQEGSVPIFCVFARTMNMYNYCSLSHQNQIEAFGDLLHFLKQQLLFTKFSKHEYSNGILSLNFLNSLTSTISLPETKTWRFKVHFL